jgi:hypothetical protein
VPAGRGGSFSKNHSPTPQSFPQQLKLEKSQKNKPLQFPVKSLNQKKLLLKIDIKTIFFLSGFSVLIYIFEEITNATK